MGRRVSGGGLALAPGLGLGQEGSARTLNLNSESIVSGVSKMGFMTGGNNRSRPPTHLLSLMHPLTRLLIYAHLLPLTHPLTHILSPTFSHASSHASSHIHPLTHLRSSRTLSLLYHQAMRLNPLMLSHTPSIILSHIFPRPHFLSHIIPLYFHPPLPPPLPFTTRQCG